MVQKQEETECPIRILWLSEPPTAMPFEIVLKQNSDIMYNDMETTFCSTNMYLYIERYQLMSKTNVN